MGVWVVGLVGVRIYVYGVFDLLVVIRYFRVVVFEFIGFLFDLFVCVCINDYYVNVCSVCMIWFCYCGYFVFYFVCMWKCWWVNGMVNNVVFRIWWFVWLFFIIFGVVWVIVEIVIDIECVEGWIMYGDLI